jgi:hypothetical protein
MVPSLSELAGPARGIVGCDWGVSYDRSAAVAIFRLPVAGLNADREPKPVFVALPYVWPQGAPLDRVVDGIVGAAPNFVAVSAEVNGVGAMPSQELARRARTSHPRTPFMWNFVPTTAASKTAGYGCVLSLLERGQLVLPRDPDLLRQLAGLKFEQRQRGFHIEADDAATHDDVSDALYLAMLPHRPPNAHRIVCRLAAMAGDSTTPEQRTPALDSPVVQTGAGLRLYQRPALQGVLRRSQGLSLYAPQVPPEPVGVKAGRFFFNTSKGVMQ